MDGKIDGGKNGRETSDVRVSMQHLSNASDVSFKMEECCVLQKFLNFCNVVENFVNLNRHIGSMCYG